jgi:uncharacterized membrane protein YphA (DoxX/SURF4 family)
VGGFQSLFAGLNWLARLIGTDPVPLAARIVLAALLATAGVYKMRHPLIAAAAAVNFRAIPRPWRTAGTALGLAETVGAVLLLAPIPTVAFVGCVMAGALSAGYVAVTARALSAEARFPCNCLPGFGADISRATLARAIAMLGAAIIGVTEPFRGTPVAIGSVLPALGLAAAAVGVPLASYTAVGAWRSYRAAAAEVDWAWVLAVRGGYAATPARRDSEAR